ncbi:hypothetical protein [Paraliobacillus ryukyuensis]|uniref:hypothetical protein n=1 Tax=Paraliobacillus ryukyuensis TaxID=200904 RepID=UPI0009A8D7C8|nr:hypothetical protein [Paraliobacillus ryukyuensis]
MTVQNVKKDAFERHHARTEILLAAHHFENGNIDIAIDRCNSALRALEIIKESEVKANGSAREA